jgi:hypothetical protein
LPESFCVLNESELNVSVEGDRLWPVCRFYSPTKGPLTKDAQTSRFRISAHKKARRNHARQARIEP